MLSQTQAWQAQFMRLLNSSSSSDATRIPGIPKCMTSHVHNELYIIGSMTPYVHYEPYI
jgi:hypothetical protein